MSEVVDVNGARSMVWSTPGGGGESFPEVITRWTARMWRPT